MLEMLRESMPGTMSVDLKDPPKQPELGVALELNWPMEIVRSR